jgi:hypothetical protein
MRKLSEFTKLFKTVLLSLIGNLRESWVGVDEQLLEVGLEPGTGFRSGLEGCGGTAVGVITDSGGIGSTVALTTWLDPDEGIEESVTSVGAWAGTETSSHSVTPITPFVLASWLLARSALVSDEVSIPTVALEERSEGVDVSLFVTNTVDVGELLSVRRAGGDGPGVVVSNVGSKTTERSWRTGGLVETSEVWARLRQIVWPSEPTSVASIEIHGNVRHVQGLDRIVDAVFISSLSVGALGDTHVGDHVGNTVGLNDQSDWDIWVILEDGDHAVNVLSLITIDTIVGDGKFTVGGKSSAVTVWKIVDDEDTNDIRTSGTLGTDISEIGVKDWDLGDGIKPNEGWDGGNSLSSGSQGSLAGSDQGWNSQAVDLRRVVSVGVHGTAREWIAGEGDWASTSATARSGRRSGGRRSGGPGSGSRSGGSGGGSSGPRGAAWCGGSGGRSRSPGRGGRSSGPGGSS